MGFLQPNTNSLLTANFPNIADTIGKLGSVYYTIFNSDGTVYEARSAVGVVEFGSGSYGVVKTFLEGTYSVIWDIDGTEYTAGEDVNVFTVKADLLTLPKISFYN